MQSNICVQVLADYIYLFSCVVELGNEFSFQLKLNNCRICLYGSAW